MPSQQDIVTYTCATCKPRVRVMDQGEVGARFKDRHPCPRCRRPMTASVQTYDVEHVPGQHFNFKVARPVAQAPAKE